MPLELVLPDKNKISRHERGLDAPSLRGSPVADPLLKLAAASSASDHCAESHTYIEPCAAPPRGATDALWLPSDLDTADRNRCPLAA